MDAQLSGVPYNVIHCSSSGSPLGIKRELNMSWCISILEIIETHDWGSQLIHLCFDSVALEIVVRVLIPQSDNNSGTVRKNSWSQVIHEKLIV